MYNKLLSSQYHEDICKDLKSREKLYNEAAEASRSASSFAKLLSRLIQSTVIITCSTESLSSAKLLSRVIYADHVHFK